LPKSNNVQKSVQESWNARLSESWNERLVSSNDADICTNDARDACITCGISSRYSELADSLTGSIVITQADGTEVRKTSRPDAKKKESDQEFFQMTYLALLLPHPQKNKLIEI